MADESLLKAGYEKYLANYAERSSNKPGSATVTPGSETNIQAQGAASSEPVKNDTDAPSAAPVSLNPNTPKLEVANPTVSGSDASKAEKTGAQKITLELKKKFEGPVEEDPEFLDQLMMLEQAANGEAMSFDEWKNALDAFAAEQAQQSTQTPPEGAESSAEQTATPEQTVAAAEPSAQTAAPAKDQNKEGEPSEQKQNQKPTGDTAEPAAAPTATPDETESPTVPAATDEVAAPAETQDELPEQPTSPQAAEPTETAPKEQTPPQNDEEKEWENAEWDARLNQAKAAGDKHAKDEDAEWENAEWDARLNHAKAANNDAGKKDETSTTPPTLGDQEKTDAATDMASGKAMENGPSEDNMMKGDLGEGASQTAAGGGGATPSNQPSAAPSTTPPTADTPDLRNNAQKALDVVHSRMGKVTADLTETINKKTAAMRNLFTQNPSWYILQKTFPLLNNMVVQIQTAGLEKKIKILKAIRLLLKSVELGGSVAEGIRNWAIAFAATWELIFPIFILVAIFPIWVIVYALIGDKAGSKIAKAIEDLLKPIDDQIQELEKLLAQKRHAQRALAQNNNLESAAQIAVILQAKQAANDNADELGARRTSSTSPPKLQSTQSDVRKAA